MNNLGKWGGGVGSSKFGLIVLCFVLRGGSGVIVSANSLKSANNLSSFGLVKTFWSHTQLSTVKLCNNKSAMLSGQYKQGVKRISIYNICILITNESVVFPHHFRTCSWMFLVGVAYCGGHMQTIQVTVMLKLAFLWMTKMYFLPVNVKILDFTFQIICGNN